MPTQPPPARPTNGLVPRHNPKRIPGTPLRRPRYWQQLARFSVVGALGYLVNLGTYAACVHAAGIDYRIAAGVAWMASVLNNFALNRLWTFRARGAAPALAQGVRFLVVSGLVFGCTYLVLTGLVSGAHMSEVLAQAVAITLGTPLNFVGQRLWTFRTRAAPRASDPSDTVRRGRPAAAARLGGPTAPARLGGPTATVRLGGPRATVRLDRPAAAARPGESALTAALERPAATAPLARAGAGD